MEGIWDAVLFTVRPAVSSGRQTSSMLLSYVGLLAYLIVAAQALQLDVHGQRKTQQAILGRRAPGIKLNNTADVSYYAELRFGGKEFTLLVDTGRCAVISTVVIILLRLWQHSSDLWIAGDVPNSKSTPFSSGINYAVGSVNGELFRDTFAGCKLTVAF